MSRDLSQIVNDLFSDPEGKDLSAQIQRLGDEIRKMIHSDETTFGKFQGLLASFKDVIPDENQRYQAALKALSTTAKLDNKEIIKAFKEQADELKIVEKGISPSLSGWSEGLEEMEARAEELASEIADLRKRLSGLEKEERTVQAGIASREKDLKSAEKTIKDLFADIGKEITDVNRKIGQLTGEPVEEEPAAEKAPGKKKKKKAEEASVEKEAEEITVTATPMDPKFQRKCPMCGGSFNLHELENLWQCYTCGHEEQATGTAAGGGASASAPAAGPVFDRSSFPATAPDKGAAQEATSFEDNKPTERKSCPACGRTMFYYPRDTAWRCNSCGYERRI
jgi:ribosomal protein L37AE/L43A